MALVRLVLAHIAVYGLALLWVCAAGAPTSHAEDDSNVEAKEASPQLGKQTTDIEEVKPEVFYVRDEEGNLVPLPGKWTFDDFRQLLDKQENIDRADMGPAYTIQKLSAKAVADTDRVRIELTLEIVQGQTGWVRVPLRMPKAILLESPRLQGDSHMMLEYVDEQTGYVAWIEGKPRDVHEFNCSLLIPLETIGEERRWQWHLPSAATSELTLTVPLPNALVESTPGGRKISSKTVGQTTETKFQGVTGMNRFSWRPPINPVRQTTRTLEASGACLVRLERGYIRSEMTLTLRSYGSPFDRFTVRLPPGARLVSETIAGGAIASSDTDSKQDDSKGQLYEVKLSQPQTGPLDVRLVTERAHNISGDGEQLELAGFEVPEAVRQFGYVAVQLIGDWQVLWGEPSNARRVESLPSSLPNMDVLAGFEYFSQPFSLPAKVTLPPTRVSVEPEYAVHVTSDALQLEGRIQYRVGGTKLYELVFDLADWEADSIRLDPSNLVNLDAVVIEEGSTLRIPLKQPIRGEFELHLSATKSLPAGYKRIEISLPRPHATSESSALLAVIPADNISLRPVTEATTSLTATQLSPKFPLPTSQQQTLLYRADDIEVKFVADADIFERQLAVAASAQVNLGVDAAELSQVWSYNVLYVPLQTVNLKLPTELRDASSLKLYLDDQPLDATKILSANGTFLETISIPLEKPRLGKVSMRLEATLPIDALQLDAATPVDVPLATALNEAVGAMELRVTTDSDVTVDLADKDWNATPLDGISEHSLVCNSAGNTASITLMARRLPEKFQRGLLVPRAWIRSWFTQTTRHERAVYRFQTALRSFEIGLPSGISAENVQVLLNGSTVPSVPAEGNRITVDLGPDVGTEHTLELLYYLPNQGPVNPLELQQPELPQGSWIDQQYWQIVLPRNEHLFTMSDDCSPIYQWGWRTFGFGRQPLLRQADLAKWVGVEPGTPVPDRANQYVFARFGASPPPRVTTVDRSWLVLVAGGAALILGMMLVWSRWLRHPLSLIVGLVGLLGAGLLYPEPVLILVQVASVGAALLLVALFIRRYVSHPVRSDSFASDSSASGSKHSTTELFQESSVRTAFALPRSATESSA